MSASDTPGYFSVKHVTPIPDTPFQRRMALGHAMRLGHEENAVHVSADGILWHKVRLCCGDTIPATVDTFGPPPAVPATAGPEDPARICYSPRCGWEYGHAGPCPEGGPS